MEQILERVKIKQHYLFLLYLVKTVENVILKLVFYFFQDFDILIPHIIIAFFLVFFLISFSNLKFLKLVSKIDKIGNNKKAFKNLRQTKKSINLKKQRLIKS